MKKLGLALLAAASLSLAAAASLHAQTLQNGSFENPALTASIAAGSGANWMPTGNAYVVTNGYGLGTTPYGTQFEYLGTGTTDAQTVSGLTLGTTYNLSLVASLFNGASQSQLTIAISGGATISQSFAIPANNGPNNTPLPFVTYSLAFTPMTSTPVTVTLSNSGDNALAMDNVQLAGGVPEPGTWALLGVSVAGLGVVTLRRRRLAPRA